MAKTLGIYPDPNNCARSNQSHKLNKDTLYGIDGANGSLVLQSMPFRYYDQYLPEVLIRECYIFTIVRNPYARAVSDFAWHKRGCATFFDFLKLVEGNLVKKDEDELLRANKLHTNHFLPQYEYIHHDKYEIDCYLKLEQLKEDFKMVTSKYGDLELHHINKSKHGSYLDYYHEDPRCIAVVNKLYEVDFKEFGYEMIEYHPTTVTPPDRKEIGMTRALMRRRWHLHRLAASRRYQRSCRNSLIIT